MLLDGVRVSKLNVNIYEMSKSVLSRHQVTVYYHDAQTIQHSIAWLPIGFSVQSFHLHRSLYRYPMSTQFTVGIYVYIIYKYM